MNRTETTINLAKSINAPSGHKKSSVLTPLNTEHRVNEWQFNAHTRTWKPPVKPSISSTETVEQDNGTEPMKNENGACIRCLITQSEANSATINPSETNTVRQMQFLPTKWGNPSGAIDVLQLRRRPTQSYQLPYQIHNTASTAREDYYIRPSVPNLKLSDFSGDPLEWPEWSLRFQSTTHSANKDDSLKKNHLRVMITGKTKETIAGLGYNAEMYHLAWHVLFRTFAKPQMVLNVQLR